MEEAAAICLQIRNERLQYTVGDQSLHVLGKRIPVPSPTGELKLRKLVDRTSIEIFVNDGEQSISSPFLPEGENDRLELYAQGGIAKIEALKIWPIRSVWPKK